MEDGAIPGETGRGGEAAEKVDAVALVCPEMNSNFVSCPIATQQN